MKYLNRKSEVAHVEVGDEVMFLADYNEAAVGQQGNVVEKGESHIVVQLAPKTAYEQENASLRTKVQVPEADLDALAFGGDLQQYEPTPKPEAKEEATTTEETEKKEDGDDTAANTAGDTNGAAPSGEGQATAPAPQD